MDFYACEYHSVDQDYKFYFFLKGYTYKQCRRALSRKGCNRHYITLVDLRQRGIWQAVIPPQGD